MTEFTIGNICKEIQRIQYDLEQYGNIASAIDRCKSLDELLCEIEDGEHTLIVEKELKTEYKHCIGRATTDKLYKSRFTGIHDCKSWFAIDRADGFVVCEARETTAKLVVNELNMLIEENEMRKEHQRALESKIRRLKDRIKVLEK